MSTTAAADAFKYCSFHRSSEFVGTIMGDILNVQNYSSSLPSCVNVTDSSNHFDPYCYGNYCCCQYRPQH
jgi:hypothetical protein